MRQFVWHETDSYLHRLNPLTKLLLTVPVAVLVSLQFEPIGPLAIAALAATATWRLGNVPLAGVLRPMAFSLLLGFGMFWTGVLYYAGSGADGPSLATGPLSVTQASLVYGLTMLTRTLAIFATSSLFVLTTDPVDFVVALIQQARLPARIGYAIFAAYRFMPLVQDELANIRAAHQVRGASSGRGPLARVRQGIGYAIPLLAISVRRAERVALAMDARGFGARRDRTFYRSTHVTHADFTFGAISLLALGASVGLPRALGL
ncbi:MAG: energy-coupling factor transporter transmembrane component T [Chloroflexota bacterium]